MTVFDYKDYKDFVRDWMALRPRKGRGQYRKMAAHMRVHPTLLSQVFNGAKDLSLEQAASATTFLKLKPLEAAMFLALVRRSRAGSEVLRKLIDQEIERILTQSGLLVNRVEESRIIDEKDQARFYSSWKFAAVRLMTTLESGPATAESIAASLGLGRESVESILEFLIETGLCTVEDGHVAPGPSITHLPADSPFIGQHHRNWRLKAMERHDSVHQKELCFSAPLTLSKDDAELFRSKLVGLVEELGKTVENSEATDLYCFNLDWLRIAQG